MYRGARVALEAAMDEWCAVMKTQDEDNRVYSRDEALR
jgi:hypothetical protein